MTAYTFAKVVFQTEAINTHTVSYIHQLNPLLIVLAVYQPKVNVPEPEGAQQMFLVFPWPRSETRKSSHGIRDKDDGDKQNLFVYSIYLIK